jgi:hypothetical protein
LNDAYCDEVGMERSAIGMPALVQTPMAFRSKLVTIMTEEMGEMLQQQPVPSAVPQIDR